MLKKKKLIILFTIPNFDTAGSGVPLFKLASRLDRNQFPVKEIEVSKIMI